jgi:anti-sigma-K factor RskA
MEHRELRQLISAHALDALDADEAARVDAHVVECAECARDLEGLREAASALAFAAPDAAPPPGLRDRILAATAPTAVPVAAPARRTRRARSWWPWRGLTVGLAAATAALAVLAVVLAGRLADARDQRDAQSRALGALASSDARLVPVKPALASLGSGSLVSGSGGGILILPRLPRAPQGKTYEAWFLDRQGHPLPAGTFGGGGATTVVQLSGDPSKAAQVAVTVERAGGVPKPQGPIVLTAKLA